MSANLTDATLEADRPEALHALAIAMARDGASLRALAAIERAHQLAPYAVEYALSRAEIAHMAGVGEGALAQLTKEAQDDPLNPALLAASGLLLHRLGRNAESSDLLEAACALAPENAAIWVLLGGVLARSHHLARAEGAMRQGLAHQPDNLDLRHDLGVVLMRMHRFSAARVELTSVRNARRTDPTLLSNLANATLCLGLQAEAVDIAHQSVAIAPDSPIAWRTLANTLPYAPGVPATDLLAALQATAARLPRQPQAPVFANQPDPNRMLRIGLLSGMLKTHPVGWLTIAGFEALDPAQFYLVGLADTMAYDPLSRRFRAVAREWHSIASLDDAGVAELARGAGIDVLIDLGGYGDLGRMSACALRLAPVQVKWVGMQNHSTGLPEMDWFITDRWESPPDLTHLYSEKLLRLPDGYVCYSPPPDAPDVTMLPALATGTVTFGCFTNLAKVTPDVLAAWSAILARLPGARLVIKSHAFRDPETARRVRAAFSAHRIAPERIELRGPSPHRAFLGEYGDIDIALDPFPYAGGLTTCEALWMGVPTVTLPGETFASRHSLSHLSNAGLSDWAAPDVAAYIALAVAKASDLPALSALRAGLRARVKASPLCDAPRFGASLGAALRHAWRAWCANH